ncbi:hypothetical protein C7I55_27245 [Sphingomonas deserti]|uniref:Uncharacterized protein n=1 Tax=Allosphingosinicella deserti TaxID=2116704 RepID=A0A2P7QE26_9SPHN|nr:hypothetical protein C7I55_27245 [Sphingomonas deserti]
MVLLVLAEADAIGSNEDLARALDRVWDFQRSGAKILGIFMPRPGAEHVSALLGWPRAGGPVDRGAALGAEATRPGCVHSMPILN